MTNTKHPWLNRQEYPFTSRYMNINGRQLHYIDEGRGPALVFVHGTPSWSFDSRKVITALRGQYRCIAPDHIGFGLSDKPARYDYSPQQHARVLEQFIHQLGLKDITLVLHDFGGPVGFQYAVNHAGNVKSIVVMNSWLWDFSADKTFASLRKVINSPLTPFLYRYLNFSPRYLLPQSFGKQKPSRQLLAHYTGPFASPSERQGALAFARSLVNDQRWFQSLWEQRKVLARKPVLFIWGMADKFVQPRFLEQFRSGFPHNTVKMLAGCGHFPQEEEPQAVVEVIRDFLDSAAATA